MSDTELPETDHTPYCPGCDIDRGFIIEERKGLQVASRAHARSKERKGSRDHAGGSRARGKGRKGSRDHADGSRARGKGSKGNWPEDRARGGARARAHARACARACARARTRGARQQYEVLLLQHLQEPLAA